MRLVGKKLSPLEDGEIVERIKAARKLYQDEGKVNILGRDLKDTTGELHHACHDVPEKYLDIAARFGVVMRHAIKVRNGDLGIAAPQLGVPWRIFVIKTKSHGLMTLINPVIIDKMDPFLSREGCLSEPGLEVELYRPRAVKLSWMTDAQRHPLSGWHRREGVFAQKLKGSRVPAGAVVDHEQDHLDGITLSTHVERGTATVIQKQEAA